MKASILAILGVATLAYSQATLPACAVSCDLHVPKKQKILTEFLANLCTQCHRFHWLLPHRREVHLHQASFPQLSLSLRPEILQPC